MTPILPVLQPNSIIKVGTIVRTILLLTLLGFASTTIGCSSTGGFSLWPESFPLLKQTKEVASQTPVGMCLTRELSEQPLPEYFVEPGDRILIEPLVTDPELDVIGDQLAL